VSVVTVQRSNASQPSLTPGLVLAPSPLSPLLDADMMEDRIYRRSE
jgi:hypothetical protein